MQRTSIDISYRYTYFVDFNDIHRSVFQITKLCRWHLPSKFWSYPLVKNSMALAALSGVFSSPWRSGFSPREPNRSRYDLDISGSIASRVGGLWSSSRSWWKVQFSWPAIQRFVLITWLQGCTWSLMEEWKGVQGSITSTTAYLVLWRFEEFLVFLVLQHLPNGPTFVVSPGENFCSFWRIGSRCCCSLIHWLLPF